MAKREKKILPTAEQALEQYWGYSNFRANQREIIDSIIAGKDTLALLPTGGGKSLTYQVPALAMDGVAIIITPLIALMKDQVDRLHELKIPSVAIHSALSMRQIEVALDNCVYGDYKLLYLAPERLASQTFRTRLSQMNVSFIAVDEAHCISQWGYDFRPSYLKINEIRQIVKRDTPILALTASATKIVREDIIKHLSLRNHTFIQGDFSRKNLCYVVRESDDKMGQLQRILNNVAGSTIIYTRTRRGTEKLSQHLEEEGYTSTFYHGGLPNAERSLRQDEWATGETRIIVATNAFGMGIDKSNVRLVVHMSPCDSIEAYYQEAGRAGRDGERSYAILLTSKGDNQKLVDNINSEFPELETIKSTYDKICSSLGIPYGEGEDTTYNFSMREFCIKEGIFSGKLNIIMRLLQNNGYLTFSEEVRNPARLMFIVKRDELYRVRITHKRIDHIIRIILRMYEGIFTEFREINEAKISEMSGYTVSQVKELLKDLWQLRLIRYTPAITSSLITLTAPRIPIENIYISPNSYLYRKKLYIDRMNSMLEYTNNSTQCRAYVMEEYFGIDNPKECGVCDICIDKRKRAKNDTRPMHDAKQSIITQLEQRGASTIKELVTELKIDPKIITSIIDELLNNGEVKFSRDTVMLDKKR